MAADQTTVPSTDPAELQAQAAKNWARAKASDYFEDADGRLLKRTDPNAPIPDGLKPAELWLDLKTGKLVRRTDPNAELPDHFIPVDRADIASKAADPMASGAVQPAPVAQAAVEGLGVGSLAKQGVSGALRIAAETAGGAESGEIARPAIQKIEGEGVLPSVARGALEFAANVAPGLATNVARAKLGGGLGGGAADVPAIEAPANVPPPAPAPPVMQRVGPPVASAPSIPGAPRVQPAVSREALHAPYEPPPYLPMSEEPGIPLTEAATRSVRPSAVGEPFPRTEAGKQLEGAKQTLIHGEAPKRLTVPAEILEREKAALRGDAAMLGVEDVIQEGVAQRWPANRIAAQIEAQIGRDMPEGWKALDLVETYRLKRGLPNLAEPQSYRGYRLPPDPDVPATTPPPPAMRDAPPPSAPAAPVTAAAPNLEDRLTAVATNAGERVQRLADSFEAGLAKTDIAIDQGERIAARGTIEKPLREEFRAAGQPTRKGTYGLRFSEADIQTLSGELVQTVRDFRAAERTFRAQADPISADAMKAARKAVEGAAKRWQVLRSAAGRAVKTFDRAVPDEIMQRLQEAGTLVRGMKQIRARIPIDTNIVRSLRNWSTLTDAEKSQFWRDVVDSYRLNLFAPTSFTLDLVGNATEVGAQVAEGIGGDLAYLSRGHLTFPSLQGIFRSIRSGASFKKAPPALEDALSGTVSGEVVGVPGQGTFTTRATKLSAAYDWMKGLPLYAKGWIDTAAKRTAAMATGYREAIMAADKHRLTGLARQKFINDFVNDPPEDVMRRMIENGNKAGFNRELTHLEEQISNSSMAKMFVFAFPRWGFQFSRWAAEMVGVNPALFRKVVNGTVTREELGGWFSRAATGLGGLVLLDRAFYDHVDFRSMEYVHENGNRTRLSGREPIATGLWMLSLIKGDVKNSLDALRYASVPFASVLAGEGGLITTLVAAFQRAVKQRSVNPRAVKEELVSSLNRAIPGQALLGALESIFDPELRDGIGANLPGISQMLPPAVDPTTGGALTPRQQLPGMETDLPTLSGVPIPGAERVLNPVHQLLSRAQVWAQQLGREGPLVYRGPRQPVAGYPAGEVPEDMRSEWQQLFGTYRNALLSPLAERTASLGLQLPNRAAAEAILKDITLRDTVAARKATRNLTKKYGTLRQQAEGWDLGKLLDRWRTASVKEQQQLRPALAARLQRGDLDPTDRDQLLKELRPDSQPQTAPTR